MYNQCHFIYFFLNNISKKLVPSNSDLLARSTISTTPTTSKNSSHFNETHRELVLEKYQNKNLIHSIQKEDTYDNKNSLAEPPDSKLSKCVQYLTKRRIQLTPIQLTESHIEKEKVQSNGIFLKKFQAVNRPYISEQSSKNINDANDCITLD